jgi:hypothetical protein
MSFSFEHSLSQRPRDGEIEGEVEMTGGVGTKGIHHVLSYSTFHITITIVDQTARSK